MVCDIGSIFSRSFVMAVNDARLGRFYRVMESVFGGFDFYVPPRFVHGHVDFRDVWFACTRTHIDIITRARDMKLPYVMIFEDDALPRPDAGECMRHYLSNIPDDCGVFALGVTSRRNVEPAQGSGFCRVFASYGSQAYIIFANAYDAFIHRFYHGPYAPMDQLFGCVATTYLPEHDIFIQHNFSRPNTIINPQCGNDTVLPSTADSFLSPDDLTVLGFPQAFPPERVKQARDRQKALSPESGKSREESKED